MSTAEKFSDAVICCLYRWMQHDGELDKLTLDAAIKQTEPDLSVGKLIRQLERIRLESYEYKCDEGYLNALHKEKAQKKRTELVSEYIGAEGALGVITDDRISILFPPTPKVIKRTNLPLSIGSSGYDLDLDYTMKGYLPANSLCSIYGPSGSYKSFLAVSWACHIAAGMKWSGRSVSSGSVLYVVGEGGIGVPRRIRAWEVAYNKTVPLDNLYLINRPIFPVRIDEVDQVILAAKQVESITGQPVRFIVIDTLARCFGGNDENDARDMGAFIEGCDRIKRETGATLLVVHHSGKDSSKGARGSSAFRAALDAEFDIRREGSGGALILTCTKMKDAEEPERSAFDLRTVELFVDSDNEMVSSLAVHDVPREPRDGDPDLVGVKNLSPNHAALWQSIRSRKAKGEPCNRSVLRDDMASMLGDNGRKGSNRWLDKLASAELISIDTAGEVTILGRE